MFQRIEINLVSQLIYRILDVQIIIIIIIIINVIFYTKKKKEKKIEEEGNILNEWI